MFYRLVCVFLWLSLVSACMTTPRNDSTEFELSKPQPGEDIRIGISDPDVVALWKQAEAAKIQKNYQGATRFLEEAIRKDPAQPLLWSKVAEIQLLAGEDVIAENFAAKSTSLTNNNPALVYRNWLIIKHAREIRGDTAGAEAAQRELDRFYRPNDSN